MRGKFSKLSELYSDNPDINRLLSKPIDNWTSFDKFICFKVYFKKSNGRSFQHNKNYGLMLIMLKRIKLTNRQFVFYLKWLCERKKLYSFWALKNHFKSYCYEKGINNDK